MELFTVREYIADDMAEAGEVRLLTSFHALQQVRVIIQRDRLAAVFDAEGERVPLSVIVRLSREEFGYPAPKTEPAQ